MSEGSYFDYSGEGPSSGFDPSGDSGKGSSGGLELEDISGDDDGGPGPSGKRELGKQEKKDIAQKKKRMKILQERLKAIPKNRLLELIHITFGAVCIWDDEGFDSTKKAFKLVHKMILNDEYFNIAKEEGAESEAASKTK